MRILKSPYFQLPFFLILGGILSMILRYESLWDFANYHYYNPWAFLNVRLMYDIAPAGVNTFFNPLPDIPLYLLIKYFNDYPNVIHFAQGLWLGGLMYAFFLILNLYFDIKTLKGKICILLAFFVGMTSWSLFFQIGSSTNEIPIAFLEVLAFYILVKAVFFKENTKSKINKFLLSGFILGAAMGLKLTAVIYCVSIGLTLLCFYKQVPQAKKNIPLFVLGGLLGVLTFYGFWGYILWEKFQNPFFPFANGIFKSEWFPIQNYRDLAYVPQTLWQYVTYPFHIFFEEGDKSIVDFRFSLVWVIVIIAVLRGKCKAQEKVTFLMITFVLTYIIWAVVFSILHYTPLLSLIASIIIVRFFIAYQPDRVWKEILYYTLWLMMFYMLLSTPCFSDNDDQRLNENIRDKTLTYQLMREGKASNKIYGYKKYLNMQPLNLPDDTLVLIYARPAAAFLPMVSINKTIRGISMTPFAYNGIYDSEIFNKGKWQILKEEILNKHRGMKVAIIAETTYEEQRSQREYLENNSYIPNMKCRILGNNIMNWSLCFSAENEKQIFGEVE